VEFRILGPLEVLDGERQVSVPGRRERAVLAYLLLHANEVVSSSRLIDELWGDEPPEFARKSVQVRIAGLRKVVGPDCIVSERSGYLVHLQGNQLDLSQFEELLSASAASDAATSVGLLDEALGLWRGPPLADFSEEPWAGGAVARLEELRVLALERRIDAGLELGRHAEVVGELEALVRAHPLRERLRLQQMLALYRAGRQADALEVFHSIRRELIDELGIEPGPALHKLERAILRQDASLDLAQAPAPERSILVVALNERNLDGLVALAGLLARDPPRELILMQPVAAAAGLPAASAGLQRRREQLFAEGIVARAAAFSTTSPGEDVVRVAAEQDVDLLLVDGPPGLLDDLVVAALLDAAPCDVAVLVRGQVAIGSVFVPFTGADHDWAAVEIGAWIARGQDVPLLLAGSGRGPRDASRLLANASLATQRALGVAAQPLLVEPRADDLVRAADQAALVVAGLSDRWRKDGLGPVRSALATDARPPVVLVRRGLRPSGLAPPESHTRFTWSIGPAT
jgi:DNA-binding SARP family transcriptional activator